jgi:hypothetical protein
MVIGVYDVWFILFCVIFISLIFISIAKNILTNFGIGLLIGIFIFGIICYDILEELEIQKLRQNFNLTVFCKENKF